MYCFVNDFLNEEQVNQTISTGEDSELATARVYRAEKGFIEDKDVRSAKSNRLKLENDMGWLKDELEEVSKSVKFLFESQYGISVDVSGGMEEKQANYLVYNEGDHFNWHKDCNPESTKSSIKQRTLSAVIQLSDPNEYEGGELILNLDGESGPKENTKKNVVVPKDKGSCCIFLSRNVFHKVYPITSGTRKALITWFHLNNDD